VRFSTTEVADHLRGDVVGPEVTIDGASIDSRSITPGQLFVPIVAERDGHAFIDAALQRGAAAYLTSEAPRRVTAVVVRDTSLALTELGALSRQRLGADIVGITGSVGKTTTKDLAGHCLASTFRTTASARSLNNELGVPLTLCNAPEDAEWVVLELGARGIGHIAELVELTRPKVGIVTSVGMAHIEFFGDLDGVATAKSELVTDLPANGLAVLNADDERVLAMRERCPCLVLTYSVQAFADVTAEGIRVNGDLQPSFELVTPWGNGHVQLRLHGLPQVSNALAAATAALWCGAPIDAVLVALSEVTGSDLRMDVRRPVLGPALIIDCYNANPLSTEAALRALGQLQGNQKVALLGRMAELGAETEEQHRRMADLAAELGISVVGYQTDLYGPDQLDTVADAVARLGSLTDDDAVLVKGSRVTRLEDVVRAYGETISDNSLVP
jgi:UDP-N-acetylmuramoyl-tripeptide--D-alanyl-D-alanine ligase